jgi:Xaa-Pro aminopeptidase
MEQGDVFSLLVETNGPGGYYCEIARAFSLGRASTELRSAVQAAIDAQAWSLDRLRDGATPRSVADANDSFLAARGQGPERRLYCHGQGYDMVERPLIRANEDMIVREGMNIVVHPGVVTAAANGLVCDNYLIGPDGPGECLHRTEKGVWEI